MKYRSPTISWPPFFCLLFLLFLAACGGPTTTVTPEATDSPTAAGNKIAILLPERANARYETQDLPNFTARLQALGFDTANNLIYLNAEQDAARQAQQAEQAVADGAKVVLFDPVDSDAAGVVVDRLVDQGAIIIAYDRLIKGTDNVSYYISFDNEQVGVLQAESLLDALAGIPDPGIVMINGSLTDNNALMFSAGAHSVLDDAVTILKEYDTPDWSPATAQQNMALALDSIDLAELDGVYAANDGTAGGAITAMKEAGVDPLPPVTGQDAELAAIQRILAGEQYMTVYKAIKPEAEAAADLAYALLQGEDPPASLVNSVVNNEADDIPSILLTPIAVTRENIAATVIADGFWSIEEICTAAYEAACAAAGLE